MSEMIVFDDTIVFRFKYYSKWKILREKEEFHLNRRKGEYL